jgi:hypothetical protein
MGNLFSQTSDSTSSVLQSFKFHLLTSFNPLLNRLNDPQETGLFYSTAPYEMQVQFKQHLFGIAYFRKQTSSQKFLNNGVKTVDDVLRHHFHVSYTREILHHNHWSMQIGGAYYFQRHDTANILYTSLENPYKNYIEKEHGLAGVYRLGYKFNSILGLYLESQIYFGISTYKYKEVYPLTPSQNTQGNSKNFKYHILLPSNLYLRISLD